MSARILDGNETARRLRAQMAQEVAQLAARGVTPGLGFVLVGENPASQAYIRMKKKACAEVGILSHNYELPAGTTQAGLLQLIAQLNADPAMDGYIVQLPLPKHIDETTIIAAIDPRKDVDCFHPVNVGKLCIGDTDGFFPCTPYGVVVLLQENGIDVAGAHVVIMGRSNIVGKPLANLLVQKRAGANATVTLCHTGTRDLAQYTRQADIVVAAIGRPNTLTAAMVRPGAVVVDVGINRVDDPGAKAGYRLVGDVDFAGVSAVAGAITPVPGGIGPMTIAMLLRNAIRAARCRGAA
ncbi:MAG: bifunctional 5,10-methylene-tetrahydrofolate dehydrogenase/5,10-methylene-tetrahydrofolate cyclohydrolase [bacterium]|nr:bifunctional 5,10-methylene-tetrahydrofolate dehydrogenase/5,10-methylene-tetrahydrofolate cyclohydrolase [bacterium]